MRQVLIRQGQAAVEEVPAPLVEAGTVLVRVDHSCISAGTELSGVRATADPLWKRGLKQPQNVKKVLHMIATQGLAKTRSVVEGKLTAGQPTGYSAAGTVLEVGVGVDDLAPGDRVACAGAQSAHHAEIIRVPRNLAVPVPDALGLDEASTVTLGAIALQGVRRAAPTLGETFVVLGLGILGQLTAQLLKAHGCRVIGTDLSRERIDLALSLGMDAGLHPNDGDAIMHVHHHTDGYGADGVIITAAGPSDAIVSTAFTMCRRKGRVILVGDVGLKLDRADFYAKELDFLISASYGPGRYDQRYEEEGLDYPVAYVRWTENRNMSEYLRLLAEGRVRVAPLIGSVRPIGEAAAAYEALKDEATRPLIALLSYPARAAEAGTGPDSGGGRRAVPNPMATPAGEGRIRLAIVGAGSFTKGMHLPNLRSLSDRYHVAAVASRTGHNASATARQFGARYATTDYEEVLADPEIDAVLVATRHDLHAGMALRALEAGKHVLVEKPLALDSAELERIVAFFDAPQSSVPAQPGGRASEAPVLLTGFNRRFSPFALLAKELSDGRTDPMLITYRMNAGHIPGDHWVHGPQGGGRNIGEACHIYDLFTYLTGAALVDVDARCLRPRTAHYKASDNFVATLTFADGSLATLTYTALGDASYPKEHMEVYVDGLVLELDDYKALRVFGAAAKGVDAKPADKGQANELVAFADAIQLGGAWPIPLWQQVQVMRAAFLVQERIDPGWGARREDPAPEA